MDTGAALQPQVRQRRSWFAPLWAKARLQGYWSLMQFRNYALVAWLTALVQMLVVRQLWIALYNGRATYQGYTLEETLTYVVLSMAITNLLGGDGVQFFHWKVRSGDILFDLMYPSRLTSQLMAFSLSSLVVTLFTIALPLLLMAVFILRVPLPNDPARWLMFGVSFLLGCLIFNWIDILASLLAFWTTETSGLVAWKQIIVGILSGAYLPLWIFPGAVEQAIAYLPFRGIHYVPLSILVGWIGPPDYPREIAVQLVWVVILALAAEGLFRLAMRRTHFQGG